jgi:hypothetical protein
MKRITRALIWLIGIVGLGLLLITYWYYNDGKLGKGNYFIYNTGFDAIKSFKDKKLYLIDISKSKYNDNYIIAIRIPVKVFYGKKDCTTFFDYSIHYLIINKHTNKVYETDDYLKFKYKVKNLNVNLIFTNQEIEQSKKKFEKNKHLYKNTKTLEYLKNNCKEDFIYPIEKF